MIVDKSDIRMSTYKKVDRIRVHHIGGVSDEEGENFRTRIDKRSVITEIEKNFDEDASKSEEEKSVPLSNAFTPTNSRSSFRTNVAFSEINPPSKGHPSLRKLMQQIDQYARTNGLSPTAITDLKIKVALLWLILKRLFSNEEIEVGSLKAQAENPYDTHMISYTTGAKAGESPAVTPAVSNAVEGETITDTRETLFFKAEGKVATQDGKDIPININLRLKDSKREITGLAEDVVAKLKDPLVINFNSDSAELSREKFNFDLDVDGVQDRISMPLEGSAFLALDRDGDGLITDGSELFGVESGDGFKDLAEFDDDKNGYIDEGDKVFHELRLFTKNKEGEDIVFTLAEKGVKAISLESLATRLRLNDGEGLLRKTGIIIKDNNTASTVQHVDLKVEKSVATQIKKAKGEII